MPRLAKQLTAVAVEKARPKADPYTLASGNGLFLRVLPGGGKQWLVRYRTPDGKRSKVIIGSYPDLSVAQAHGKAAEVHLAARTDASIVGVRAQARARAASLTEAE